MQVKLTLTSKQKYLKSNQQSVQTRQKNLMCNSFLVALFSASNSVLGMAAQLWSTDVPVLCSLQALTQYVQAYRITAAQQGISRFKITR